MDNQPNEQKSTSKVITVDQAKCIGCGLCVTTCPDVFELSDEDQKSHVKDASACAPKGGSVGAKCNCQEAIDHCPAKAIFWQE